LLNWVNGSAELRITVVDLYSDFCSCNSGKRRHYATDADVLADESMIGEDSGEDASRSLTALTSFALFFSMVAL
jgi:hypothetical protein